MAISKPLTVTGWVIATEPLTLLESPGRISTRNAIVVYVDSLTDGQRRPLPFTPQPLLVDYSPGVARTRFALAFMQRIEISAEFRTVTVLTHQGVVEARLIRQRVSNVELNMSYQALFSQLPLPLVRLEKRMTRLRQAFIAGTLSFELYQQQQTSAAKRDGDDHFQHSLINIQTQQRRIWGQAHYALRHETYPQLLLSNGQARQLWPGKTTLSQETLANGAVHFSLHSPLPRVQSRKVNNLRYREKLLAPLRRGYATWVKQGRPVNLALELPPELQQQFAGWQAYQTKQNRLIVKDHQNKENKNENQVL